MEDYLSFNWEEKNLKEKAIDTTSFGAVVTPISIGILSLTEPQSAYEAAQSVEPYALSAGVTTGKALWDEGLYRVEEILDGDSEEAETDYELYKEF